MTELQRGRAAHRGAVTSFDAAVGLGVVTTADGEDFSFHCIEIADGTRSIDVGAAVRFDVLPKFGRHEAANLQQ